MPVRLYRLRLQGVDLTKGDEAAIMTNIEIKARYIRNRRTRHVLNKIEATYHSFEKQIDTYFRVEYGLLKIRERIGETSQIIQYVRSKGEGPVPSHYEIVHLKDEEKVMTMLDREHGLKGVVRKQREIWLWENVRIHFDHVDRLGKFIEFEAVMDEKSDVGEEAKKIRWLMDRFSLTKKDIVFQSYIDFFCA